MQPPAGATRPLHWTTRTLSTPFMDQEDRPRTTASWTTRQIVVEVDVGNPGLARRDPAPPARLVVVLGWDGMRGAISLAAALAVPVTPPFPERDLIVFLAFDPVTHRQQVAYHGSTPLPPERRVSSRATAAGRPTETNVRR